MNEQIFDRMHVAFWKAELENERLDRDVRNAIDVAKLSHGSWVLDLGCGNGRMSIALARRGMQVVGIDRSPDSISEARRVGGGKCRFILADWRNIPATSRFDCVLFWFTTLVAGRDIDLQSLRIARANLVEQGALLIETRHWDRSKRRFDIVTERSIPEGTLTETHAYDPATGIQTSVEHFRFLGRLQIRTYQIRRYGFAELRDLCYEAGFEHVDGFDECSLPLSDRSERVIIRAQSR